MNIADIEKVANRKRINAEAEKLREKVTRETANIIKLKVAQDTAYWDLKEKLHQLENNHERLQQNMVEVQMQHETISGQYQDELRLRPETLNKLSSTREICDVLEEYSERLKATLSRCKADQATLAEAYSKSGQLVRDIKGQQIQAEEKSQQLVKNLQEKLKLVTEHKDQMAQLFASAKQHLEGELNDARAKLTTSIGQKDELFVALNDFSRKLDHFKRELEKKDENIASLQMDMKKLVNEYTNEATEMKNLLIKKEKDLKDFSDANESLKKALQNQDQYSKSTCEQNNQLQEKIYSLEVEQTTLSDKLKDAEKRFEEANALCNQFTKEIESLNERNAEFQKEFAEKIMLLEQNEIEHQNLKTNISALELEKSQVAADLREVTTELVLKSDKIKDLASENQNLGAKLAEMESVLKDLKIEHSNQINEHHVTLDSKEKAIQVKDKELDCKATTINQLMSDLKNVTDAKTKLENTVEKLKKENEVEKEKQKEKETVLTSKIEHLEISVKNKEDELSKQMTIILDIRNEKVKLQERLKGMQNTIDNIQKEVTGRNSFKPREAPEQDDNAVMMTPVLLQKQIGINPPKNQPSSKMPPPQVQKKQQDLMYNLFSDSSMDNDLAIDSEEINRRFDAVARGEAMSPLTLKRRKGPPVTLGGLKPLSDKNVFANSQATESSKVKRTFFKSKRSDNKVKKFKPGD